MFIPDFFNKYNPWSDKRKLEKEKAKEKKNLKWLDSIIFDLFKNSRFFDFNSMYKILDDAAKAKAKDNSYQLLGFEPDPDKESDNSKERINTALKIIDSMTFTQRQNYRTMRTDLDKQLVAKRAEIDLEEVEQLFNNFSGYRGLHKRYWKYRDSEAIEYVPNSLEELLKSQETDKRWSTTPPPINVIRYHNRQVHKKLFEEARKLQPKERYGWWRKVKNYDIEENESGKIMTYEEYTTANRKPTKENVFISRKQREKELTFPTQYKKKIFYPSPERAKLKKKRAAGRQ